MKPPSSFSSLTFGLASSVTVSSRRDALELLLPIQVVRSVRGTKAARAASSSAVGGVLTAQPMTEKAWASDAPSEGCSRAAPSSHVAHACANFINEAAATGMARLALVFALLAPTVASAIVLPAHPAALRMPALRMVAEEQPAAAASVDVAPAVDVLTRPKIPADKAFAQQLLEGRPALKKAYRKLVTREDRFSAHKTLGVFCVLHAAFRLSQVGPADMGFGPTLPTLACILLHATLSLSSFLFRIPLQRRGGDLSCA